MNVIGPQIKRLREQNHMTQEELTAGVTSLVGISVVVLWQKSSLRLGV